MARLYTDTNCKLHGTKYCAALNMINCGVCTVRDVVDKDVESIMRDIDIIEGLLPECGIGELFTDENCVLCKNESSEPRKYYAFTDLGHAEPKLRQTGFLGIRRAAKMGSILPVQLSCCKRCKNAFLLTEYLPICVGLLVSAGALIALSFRTIREMLLAITHALPFLAFVFVTLAGIALGLILRKTLVKRFSQRTHMNIFEIPKLKEMRRKGWFELYESRGVSKLIFSKNRLRQGLFTNHEFKMK